MLNNELRVEDPWSYTNFLRLNHSQFESLLSAVSNQIQKQDTVMRECISARSKLEVTLRFLSTGESFRSLMYATRIHETTISRFVPEVCQAIANALKIKYLKFPKTVTDWQQIADDYWNLWQFPHCLGALDGKHIAFRAPISDGSFYYNYKGGHSIVLLGLVDARYRFIYVNIGVNGRHSDGGVFSRSNLAYAIQNNTAHFSPPATLPGLQAEVPYVIIADEAFPLMKNLMKPYPGRELSPEAKIFNYRLSRARRMVESAFGILANRFRILLNPINLNAEKVESLTLTCVLLHNLLASENAAVYTDMGEGSTTNLQVLGRQCSNRSSTSARAVRDTFKNFFNSEAGMVAWQENAIQAFNM
nr:unnamed protein product [Callosobruchus analis]